MSFRELTMIDFSSPTFVSVLLIAIYVLLAVALLVVGWSALRSLRRNRSEAVSNGLPVRRMAWGVVALVVVVLVLTCLLASTKPMVINGHTFDNSFWLRISDMLISTSLILIGIAVIGVLFGMSGLSRKLRIGK